jgi:hypothetical protein
MKKIIMLAICVMALCTSIKSYAQNHLYLNVTEIDPGGVLRYCEIIDSITISKEPDCNDVTWVLEDVGNPIGEYHTDEITVPNSRIDITYVGCDIYTGFFIRPLSFNISEPWPNDYVWKRTGETIRIEAFASNVNNQWSTGATASWIDVTEPGTYWVHMYNDCGELWDTIQVRDNVEIESASVDPDSNKNLVTWDVTPAQAEYITNVTVTRDGVDLATVPYTNGQFLDNIGSDLAARIYTVTGISVEGTPCPIPSLERGTIHMAFLPDINGNVEMTWNAPHLGGAPIHVGRYEICEYDPNGKGEVIVIDFVSPGTTSYSCSQSMFDYGYPLIRAIIQDDRGRGKDMLSNRTDELVGIHEVECKSLTIYPNPTQYSFTVSGVEKGKITLINSIGQQVLCQEITGETTINVDGLPSGIYVTKVITPEGMMYTEKVVVQ